MSLSLRLRSALLFGLVPATFLSGAARQPQAAPASRLASYILQWNGQQEVHCVNLGPGGLGNLRALRARFGDAFLWFRWDRKDYVIRDPQVLARAHALLGPEREADGREADLDRLEEALDRRQEALEARLDKLEESLEKLDDLEEAGQDVAARRSALQKERVPLEREERDLQREQEGLARRQEDLGREAEKASRAGEKALAALLEEALRTGLAVRAEPDGANRKR